MPDFYRDTKYRNLLILFLSSIPFLIHLYTNLYAGYGFFRDELYYIACTNRLDTGYVDHPPFSIFILYINRLLFGDSIFALRFIPALNSGLTVFITCLMAREFGGKTFSIILSSIAVILAPIYLGMNAFYSMNSFDLLFWALAFYLIMLIIDESKMSYWIYLGLIFGFGLLNKIGILWLGFGFLAGLLATDKRKELLTLKPYLCTFIALAIFSPYIIWNFQNDFAHIEFIKNATSGKYSGLDIFDFITGQFMNVNPVSAVIWLSGLYYLMFNHQGVKYKMLVIIYFSAFLILILNGHSKAGYLAPAYTMLFAAGSTYIDKKTVVRSRWVRYAIMYPLILTGFIFAPVALPILPVETYIGYSASIGMKPSTSENKELSELPQFYADMHGWEKLAENVSKVYETLPRDERLRTIVYGRNYGEASALEFYRAKYPIPRIISSHNSYWIWGYPEIEDPVIIIIGGSLNDHLETFEEVNEILVHTAEYSMPYENNIPIFIAKRMKVPISYLWDRLKNYD